MFAIKSGSFCLLGNPALIKESSKWVNVAVGVSLLGFCLSLLYPFAFLWVLSSVRSVSWQPLLGTPFPSRPLSDWCFAFFLVCRKHCVMRGWDRARFTVPWESDPWSESQHCCFQKCGLWFQRKNISQFGFLIWTLMVEVGREGLGKNWHYLTMHQQMLMCREVWASLLKAHCSVNPWVHL